MVIKQYASVANQLIQDSNLNMERSEYTEFMKELKVINTLCENADEMLVSPEVIGSILVTYMSRADKRRLSAIS